MEEYIEKAIELYVQGLITCDELAEMLAKEYVRLWANGRILSILGLA